MWQLVEQIEKVKKVERKVNCRHMRVFPIQNGGDTSFGRFRFVLLKVIIEHDIEKKEHSITWNNRPKSEELAKGKENKLNNTFIYHWPNKEQDTFTSLASLENFLRKRGDIADKVVSAFKTKFQELNCNGF